MLILKQNAANSVPTPPAGKGTIFLDDSDTLSVKTSDGNVETFPTVGAANSQVVYVNGTSLTGENAFTYDFNNNVLTVSGNIAAGNVLTNNLLYSNGLPWDLSDPGGSNTQIQFNDDESFGGSAAFTFNKSTNVVAVTNVLLAGANAAAGDFVNSSLVASKGDTGVTDSSRQAVVGEALASAVDAIGVQGIGKTSGAFKGTGLQGLATVSATGDTGAAVGVRGYANATHVGGYNIGVLGNASGSGLGNYAFYVQAGNIGSIETDTAWDLNDNSANALAFNSTGKANILAISTVDGSEGVSMSGTLGVTGNLSAGNANLGNAATANFFIGSGANLTNLPAGNISGQVANALVAGTVYTAAQPNITSVGTLSSLAVTGNVTAGNVGGANLVSANFVAGTLTTNAQPNVTSVGTLTSLSVTGNVSAGNLSGTLISGTLETAAQPNITSVGTLTGLGVNGNITAANITANTGVFTGNAAGLTNIPSGNISGQVANALVAGTVYTNAQPNITSVGTLSSLAVTGNASAGNINAGNLLTANFVAGTLTTAAQPNITSVGTLSSLDVSGNANVGNIGAAAGIFTTVAGNLTTAAQPNVTSLGTLTGLDVNGNITAANITANTGVFTGNAAGLTNIPAGNISGQVANALVAGTVYTNAQPNITSVGTLTGLGVNGTVTASAFTANTGVFTGNGSGLSALTGANVTGQVANALVAGTVYTNSQPNITSVGTLSSLSVTGTASAGNLSTGGNLTVSGTGSFGGNVAMGNFWITGLNTPVNDTDAATKKYVDDVAQGLNIHDSCQAATPDTLANITSGTITYNNGTAGVGANLVTTGSFNLIDGVNVQTSGTRILVKNEANAVHNGIYTWANSTTIVRATDYNSVPEVEAGDFTFVTGGTLYDNTGWVQTSSPAAIGGASDLIEFTQFSGAGTYQAGTGLTLTGPTFSVNASQTQVTALGTVVTGTWNSLVGSSATFAAGLSGANLASITGANVTGQVGNALVAGTVYTAAQPNITSVGTLTSLGVNGTVTAVAFTANTGVFTGNGSGLSAIAGGNVTGQVANALVAGTVYTAAQPNITSVGTLTGLGVNGTITGVNITANTGVFTGNAAGLTNIPAGNISGQVANALVAGTVYTAAQPNITSVGTLTSVDVTGNGTFGNVYANSGTVGASLLTGTLTTAAQPNITSVGTLSSLAVTGNVTSGNVYANSGTVGASLLTGTLTTAAQPNVTSLGTLTGLGVNGNITAVNITANTGVFTGNGSGLTALNASNLSTGTVPSARLTGSYSISVDSATTAGTVTTAAQPNITSVGTLTSLTVSGNLVCSAFFDASVNAAVSAAGTVQGNATVIASEINVVSTVASGAGVALPTAVAGVRVTVINTGANALLVYPASGAAINALATNAAYSLPVGGRLEFVAVSTTQWYTLNATYG